MDLKRAVTYRSTNLNDAVIDNTVGAIIGTQITRVRYGGVPGVGYTEKRAHEDGRDASDVYQEARTLTIEATTYGSSRGDLFDRYQAIVAALTPRLAYLASPTTQGYSALAYSMVTADTDYEDDEFIRSLFMLMRPKAQPEVVIDRDKTGGMDAKPLAISWIATLEAKDPRVYVSPLRSHAIDNAGEASVAMVNRGDYPTPLAFTINVLANKGDQTVTISIGGVTMTVTMEDDTSSYALTYDAKTKVLYKAGSMRMDLLALSTENMHPYVPAGGGTLTYTVSEATTIDETGSAFTYYEAYA